MAEHSTIEWTDATWNPITGCAIVSPGCRNCYAMRLAGTRLAQHPSRAGLTVDTKAGPVWTGEIRLNEAWLTQPLAWRRPRRIFVCAHGDLFAEGVPDEWIDRVFAVMALAPQHTFQVLTKRSARMRAYIRNPRTRGRIARVAVDRVLIDRAWAYDSTTWPVRSIGDIDLPDDVTIDWPLANVWLGVSAEDQARAEERVPDLLATPASVRFVSAEPLLGSIDLTALDFKGEGEIDALNPRPWLDEIEAWRGTSDEWEEDFVDWFDLSAMPSGGQMSETLDWIIVGGESGRGARPMQSNWARQIRDHCDAAGTAFFFKQWGQCLPSGQIAAATGRPWSGSPFVRMDKKGAGRLLDGRTHDAMPERSACRGRVGQEN